MTFTLIDRRRRARYLSKATAAPVRDIEDRLPNTAVAILRMLAGVGDHTDDALYGALEQPDRVMLLERISELAIEAATRIGEQRVEQDDPPAEGGV